jgi:hypothetical protein
MVAAAITPAPPATTAGAPVADGARPETNESDAISPHESWANDREQRIAELAYRHAEQRGFAPGGELDDWLAAEREVDQV